MKISLNFFQSLALIGVCASLLVSPQANAQIFGDAVNAANTFENPDFTGSAQTIFALESATVSDPGVEFAALAGIYDVDFTGSSMTMTLTSNTGLSFLEYAAGTFDRYYFGFDSNSVDSVTVSAGDTQLTNGLTVGVLDPGFELDVLDLFATGIPVPVDFSAGGFFIQFGEGTNLETLGVNVTVDFATTAVPEPSSAALLLGLVGFCATRRSRRA